MSDDFEPTRKQLQQAMLGMMQGIMCVQAETLRIVERASSGKAPDVLKAMSDLREERGNRGALNNELAAIDAFIDILRGKHPDPIA